MFWPHLLFAREKVFVSIKSHIYYIDNIVVTLHDKSLVIREIRT